jgi:hypothetical protein
MTYQGNMTHKEKILTSLRRAGSLGACTEELTNEWHIRRVGARIMDLRNDNKAIATLKCKDHGDARYVLVAWRREQTPIEPDYDALAAERKELSQHPPDPEPPADDVEDTFHTSAVWEDDGGDAGHDSQVDQANGEGL